jgi:hypothetical protein
MSLKKMLSNKSSGKALLAGRDVPVGTKKITITVSAIRESPASFSAPGIIDFKTPIYGKSAWAVNKTNMKSLIEQYGEDETELVGKKLQLEVVPRQNPQTGEEVRSLALVAKKKGKKRGRD